MTPRLTITNHDRNVAGLTYVYPVISRRAGGLSIGINVNTNNACNWRCVYCQVPELKIGSAPEINFALLRDELRFFLNDVLTGDFYDRFDVETDKRVIKDIAISGNGEPTSAKNFAQLITVTGKIAQEVRLFPATKFVLITNGSLIHKSSVQEGLKALHSWGGEVWFKLDSATQGGRQKINNSRQSTEKTLSNLRLAAELCKTKIQTCLLNVAGEGWSEVEQNAYLSFLGQIQGLNNLTEIMLYTLARPSLQPEALYIKALAPELMERFAARIRMLGFTVSVN